MAFIKHGDGKIVSVIEAEELTDEQKKSANDKSQQVVKNDDGTDSSKLKKSGR